ncbi:MAG: hypothetical protein SNH35_05020 [Rikenellaceae bacterium]
MKRILTLLTILIIGITTQAHSAEKKSKAKGVETVHVTSLKELISYMSKDSINLTMTPGTYRISTAEVSGGKYKKATYVNSEFPTYGLLLVSGNGSYYDLSGVIVEVETGVASAFPGGKHEVVELHFIGNGNVVKGLKLVNWGSKHKGPKYGWCNVVMDGSANRAEEVTVHSTGSVPYGYGEVFGKGRGNTLTLKKHSTWLVRGDNNHVKNCNILQRTFGHHMFIQGAMGAIIEGCHIEGEMVTTDMILAEHGTGSKADKINFKTVFGYKVPGGYTLSTGEDGIRTYANGTTYINGKSVTRGTGGDIIIRNCTVKHARSGISLTEGGGTRYVENCTLIGCQDGYSIRSGGKIVNCRADAEFGPALRFVNNNDRNTEIDITITPYMGENKDKYSGNGSKHLAHIFGTGHNITLRRGEGLEVVEGITIAIGGDSRTVGNLGNDQNYIGNSITLVNETGYPIALDDNTKNGKITTNSEVTDNGVDNTIIKK